MTDLRIMQVVCDDIFKASACLSRASTVVDVVGDDKLRLRKSIKFGAKVRLFFDGIDQEATTDALQHAFFKFGQVMWLKQDDIDDQLEIDGAHKRRKWCEALFSRFSFTPARRVKPGGVPRFGPWTSFSIFLRTSTA